LLVDFCKRNESKIKIFEEFIISFNYCGSRIRFKLSENDKADKAMVYMFDEKILRGLK
tara:strand:- start:952 stop:1125 length:174 start_codon:yes stop_codon:yes gene_type:complete